MKIVIPMAGRGSRLRPHTLTVPKPLMPVAGKPIVQKLVEDIAGVVNDKIEEIAFIIGDFGSEVEQKLAKIAEDLGAKASIYYQEEALGTAHAILCAKESLNGNVIVAFADTLFRADFTLDNNVDGTIWVKKIENPSAFGVVKINEKGHIVDFVEKPQTFVSDLAIIGVYYFKNAEILRDELQYLIDNDLKEKGEYQITNALENMQKKGQIFKPGEVSAWMDCGNKKVTVETNQRVLEFEGEQKLPSSLKNENSIVIQPCVIGENVELNNSVIGPYVSIGNGTRIDSSIVKNSIIQSDTVLNNANIKDSMVGNKVNYEGSAKDLSIGDFTHIVE